MKNININNINNINKNIDKYEFYSYVIYMYGYGFFYLFIFEQKFLKALFFNLFINFTLNYTIDHNIIKFITHKYWKNNYITIPINLFIFYLIDKIYNKEIPYSRNLRLIILGLFILSKFII